jgi:hypothetical protein
VERRLRCPFTHAAFEAIAVTLPFGSIGFERYPADDGQRLVEWPTRED